MSEQENQKNNDNPLPGKLDGGEIIIEESRQFYRDGYRKLLRIVWFQSVANGFLLVLIGLVIYAALHVKPLIEAVSPSMQVQPVIPLTAPYVSSAGASAWATKALEDTMNISFSEWQQDLSDASKYYQPDAFKQLIAGLKSSGILQKIVDQRLNTVLMPVSAAYVLKSGKINGIPAWIVRGKFELTFEGATGNESTQTLNAQIILQRAPILQHPSGLVIRSVVLS